MFMPFIPQAGLPFSIVLDYDGDYADVDIFTAAGSPVDAVDVIVNMASGTDFYASTTSTYACDCNGFATGSKVTFNMTNAHITGAAGAGGTRGLGPSTASAGGDAGHALRLGCETIFNETGTSAVRGGGGGGGGGGGYRYCSSYTGPDQVCTCSGCTDTYQGNNGGDGEAWNAAAGTRGGAFGTAGSAGPYGTGAYTSGCAGNCGHVNGAGGAGGAAGDAIKTQSNSYTLNGVGTAGSIA